MNNSTFKWPWTALMFLVGVAGGFGALKYIPILGARPATPAKAATVEPAASSAPNAPKEIATAGNLAPPSDALANRSAAAELNNLRREISELKATQNSSSDLTTSPSTGESQVPPGTHPPGSAATTSGERTLAYWNGMNAIMEHEAAMRAAPPQITSGNALSFVGGETAAYQYAAEAIRGLNREAVDPDVIALAREIVGWYRQGIANSQIATSLLQSTDIASRQGQPGQDWQSAEKQHREQCLQINTRGEQLREALSRKYGLGFPKLQ